MTKKPDPATREPRPSRPRTQRTSAHRGGTGISSAQERPTPSAHETIFALGSGAAPRTLTRHLRSRFDLRLGPRHASQITYFDTADWRLHEAGLRLSIEEDDGASTLALWPVGEGRSAAARIDKTPAFASDLDSGPLRRRLESVAKVRRLIPLARLECRTRCHAIVDDEEKTVVRLYFDHCRAHDPQGSEPAVDLPAVLRIARVEGYGKAHERVLSSLAERRGLKALDGDPLDRALRALGRVPEQRRGAIEAAPLDPGAPAGAAFLSLQRGLFESMKRQLPGIRADLDSEFLHDFRVAVRRSRVLHRVFRDVIASSAYTTLLPELKWLGKVTGPTRDLDVHLLELIEQQQQASPEEAELLQPLVNRLRERRREAWEDLIAALDSPRFSSFVALATDLLDPPEGEAALRIAESGPPLEPWSSRKIARAYRRMLKDGRKIDRSSPDEWLHALRIDGKKLRYLLEFFRSLHRDDEMRPLLKKFRRLQDNLGAFNDACVQINVLRDFARDLDRLGRSQVETMLLVGRLIERAEVRKGTERDVFEARFERFEAPETRDRFRRVFGDAGRREKRMKTDGPGSEEEAT